MRERERVGERRERGRRKGGSMFSGFLVTVTVFA
jgi:hypothetical protein